MRKARFTEADGRDIREADRDPVSAVAKRQGIASRRPMHGASASAALGRPTAGT